MKTALDSGGTNRENIFCEDNEDLFFKQTYLWYSFRSLWTYLHTLTSVITTRIASRIDETIEYYESSTIDGSTQRVPATSNGEAACFRYTLYTCRICRFDRPRPVMATLQICTEGRSQQWKENTKRTKL